MLAHLPKSTMHNLLDYEEVVAALHQIARESNGRVKVANAGKSACNGDCAVKWPPVLATANDKPQGPYTIVVRDDGRRQWAYRGKPVYTWPEDQEPGDKFGDNYLKVWHIVRQ